MSNRIFWTPPSELVVRYVVSTASASGEDFEDVATILEDRTRPPFDVSRGRYYFDDSTGTPTTLYRVKAYDLTGLVADTGVFQPRENFAAALATRVKVDTHFGLTDALRYTHGGVGIPDASIKVYREADYLVGRTETPLFLVKTDATGRWRAPIYLEPGMDYVLVYSKEAAYGPDVVTITV